MTIDIPADLNQQKHFVGRLFQFRNLEANIIVSAQFVQSLRMTLSVSKR